MTEIYLDYSADTPPDERVLSAYIETAKEKYSNPNSAHSFGRSAKAIVDSALTQTAAFLNVSPDELILTSGASEANNLAIKGIAHSSRRRGKHIVSTFLEHSSVSGALTFLQEQGWEIDLVNILPDGKIDLAHLKTLLRQDTVVIVDREVLGKPHAREDAVRMMQLLSGRAHEVVTAVTIRDGRRQETFSVSTQVHFEPLSQAQIDYYIDQYQPFDKAGAYGIQEWIGYVGISSIEGSFYNVMGFPVHRVWEVLQRFL